MNADLIRRLRDELGADPVYLSQKTVHDAADALEAAEAEVARLREAINAALQCTPHVAAGGIVYDCGNPWVILREALSPTSGNV